MDITHSSATPTHLPLCPHINHPTVLLLNTSSSTALKKALGSDIQTTFSRYICMQYFKSPPLSEYTNMSVVQRATARTTGCTQEAENSSLTDLPNRIKNVFPCPSFCKHVQKQVFLFCNDNQLELGYNIQL